MMQASIDAMRCSCYTQARWAHITDVFAVGPRQLMAAYMTIFRGCLYTTRAPLFDTHPRWDSEVKLGCVKVRACPCYHVPALTHALCVSQEKLEKCLEEMGVEWQHVGHWRFVALRARSSCGSTGCWDQDAENDDSADDGPFRYFRNGTRAF
jgi:hypothetical protein